MSILDKVIAAVTPPESEEARGEARTRARAAAEGCGWLGQVLDHHVAIELAFAGVKAATDAPARVAAEKTLAIVLNAHALAEEVVLYPALALGDAKAHSAMAYDEQSMTKVQMAALAGLDPMSTDYLDKLEHIEGALAHHVFQEEGNWFLELQQTADPESQHQWGIRYRQEYERYAHGAEMQRTGAAVFRPFATERC